MRNLAWSQLTPILLKPLLDLGIRPHGRDSQRINIFMTFGILRLLVSP
jgi:hypothetical protein